MLSENVLNMLPPLPDDIFDGSECSESESEKQSE